MFALAVDALELGVDAPAELGVVALSDADSRARFAARLAAARR